MDASKAADMPPAKRRLMRDYRKVQKDAPSGISAVPVDKELMAWDAVMFGPDGTSWEGGMSCGCLIVWGVLAVFNDNNCPLFPRVFRDQVDRESLVFSFCEWLSRVR